MTEAVLTSHPQPGFAVNALDVSARLWFLVATLGQWIFAAYIAAAYAPLLMQGGLEGLKKAPLFNGFIPGDTVGNTAVAAHILLAVIIMCGGPLQLIPQVRAAFPTFHRWLGRTYVLAALASSIAALYLIWTRPLFGPLVNNLGTSFNGVLIIVCASFALRYAIVRDISTHRRWALRLFMVAGGVWFGRIGTQVWLLLTGGIGIDFKTYSGPFQGVWHFGQFLLPLAVLELYFRARNSANAQRRSAVAAGILVLTILMGAGIFRVTVNSFLSRL